MAASERRLAAILFSDIVGYTALMERDEAAGLRIRDHHRSVLGSQAQRYGGEVVDENGDELVLCFRSAVDAVNCALATQAQIASDPELELRIGIHTGDVIFEDGSVFGDGVNVASRVRPHAEPGGVCVSEVVYDAVKNQPNIEATSLGEQVFKNVARPVEVFAISGVATTSDRTSPPWRTSPARIALASAALVIAIGALSLWVLWPRPLGLLLDLSGAGAPPVDPPLPGKPSIVVLPFENLSTDPEQEYFVDGMTEELIGRLSHNPGLFVISRSSAFSYKGSPVRIADVARELGVRYVLEGSVRRDEGRVRITAQLIDATQDVHLWSEQYDRDMTDIFALQSEVTGEILAALAREVRSTEVERWERGRTPNLLAYDAFLKGTYEFEKYRRTSNFEARRWFARSFELDPAYGEAKAMYGLTHFMEYAMGWNGDPRLLETAEASARRALELDPLSASAWSLRGNLANQRREFSEALAAADRAIELLPNFDVFYLVRGFALAGLGRFLPALQSIEQALRLNPHSNTVSMGVAAELNYLAGRTATAVEIAERARDANPDLILPRILLAGHYQSAGDPDEARTLVREMLQVNPDLTNEIVDGLVGGMLGDDGRSTLRDQLSRAGLPSAPRRDPQIAP